jgi:hypothetical protein
VNYQIRDEMGRASSTNWEKRNVYRKLMGKPERKRPLVVQSHRWVDNVKMNIREIGWCDVAQDRDQWRAFCEHSNEPSWSIKCWEVLK